MSWVGPSSRRWCDAPLGEKSNKHNFLMHTAFSVYFHAIFTFSHHRAVVDHWKFQPPHRVHTYVNKQTNTRFHTHTWTHAVWLEINECGIFDYNCVNRSWIVWDDPWASDAVLLIIHAYFFRFFNICNTSFYLWVRIMIWLKKIKLIKKKKMQFTNLPWSSWGHC